MNDLHRREFPLSAIYENLDVPDVVPIKLNHSNTNFTVLSDSSRSGGDLIESGEGTFNASIKGSTKDSSDENNMGNSSNFNFREVVSCLASFTRSYTDLDVAITARDEQ